MGAQTKNSKTAHIWEKNYPDGIDWNAGLNLRPVGNLIDAAAQDYGNGPAIDFLGKKYSWADIADAANKLAKGLLDLGVTKSTKIGLFLPNCPAYIIGYFAIMKTGATAVNFNPLYAERELKHQLEDSETDIMITSDLSLLYDKMAHMLDETRLQKLIICPFTDMLPFPKNFLFRLFKKKDLSKNIPQDARHVRYEELIDNDGQLPDIKIDPEKDIALLQYTGGTTGVPKGAMLTHANITANVEQVVYWFIGAEKGQERMLGVLPLFHVFAMTAVMNIAVRYGMEISMLPRFDLDQTLKLIHKKKPTIFPAVPAIYNAINNHPDLGKYDLSSIRYCISGGAPLPVEVKKSFEKKTGCVLVEGYGLTESSPVACVNPIEGINKAGSIGLPVPQTVIDIISKDDRKTTMPVGENGEVCISGPQVMKGYWNKPDETKDTLRKGRLHTGDVGYMDEDGYIFIVDRMKDMIITNGYNVYPRNVEEAIYLHDGIEECVVGGIPDKDRGERVKAWIKLKNGKSLSEEELKTFLKDKLSRMEMPKDFDFRDEPLPKTMIGKLSRKDLLEEEAGSQGS